MMRKVNSIIARIGADRLLHLFLFAWVVSEAKAFGVTAMWVAYWLMAVLSVAKEMWLDDKCDVEDALFGAAGGAISVVIYYFST